jgi:hypothetical protein
MKPVRIWLGGYFWGGDGQPFLVQDFNFMDLGM